MSPSALRVIGIVFLLAAAALAVLNLRRVAGLGAAALPSALVLIGMACILRARRRRL